MVIELDELLHVHLETITNPHLIRYYQLLFIIEGSGNLWIDSNKYSFQNKDMLAVSKGLIQIMEFSKNIKGFAILFSEEYIYKHPRDIGWVNNLLLFDHATASPIIKLQDIEYLELLIILSKVRAEISSENSFVKDEILFSLLKTFLLITERVKRAVSGNDNHYEGEWHYLNKFKESLEA